MTAVAKARMDAGAASDAVSPQGLDVVTGATGHVGNNLVRELLARGRRVRVVVRRDDAPSLAGLEVEVARADVRDLGALRKTFEGAERVFHLAALISIQGERGGLVRATNVDGAGNAAAAAREAGVSRMVHFSSVHAFDQAPLDCPLDEERPRVPQRRPHPAYDRSKAAGEARVREEIARGLDAVIVHPSAVVGPRDYQPSRMGRALLAMYRGAMPALVAGGFDWVDVRDVVRGAIAAAERGRAGTSYILSGQWHSIAELAVMVRDLPGARPPRLVCPMWLARMGAPLVEAASAVGGGEPLFTRESLRALRANRVMLHGRASRDLGYRVRPTEETVRDLFAWFATEGIVPGRVGEA